MYEVDRNTEGFQHMSERYQEKVRVDVELAKCGAALDAAFCSGRERFVCGNHPAVLQVEGLSPITRRETALPAEGQLLMVETIHRGPQAYEGSRACPSRPETVGRSDRTSSRLRVETMLPHLLADDSRGQATPDKTNPGS